MKIIQSKRYSGLNPEWSESTFYSTIQDVDISTGQPLTIPVEYVMRWDSQLDGSTGGIDASIISIRNEKTNQELDPEIKQKHMQTLLQDGVRSLKESAPNKPGELPNGW